MAVFNEQFLYLFQYRQTLKTILASDCRQRQESLQIRYRLSLLDTVRVRTDFIYDYWDMLAHELRAKIYLF